MSRARKAEPVTSGETEHATYQEARAYCVETGATHATEPSGKCQSFYRRSRFMDRDDCWGFCVVFLRSDGQWVKGPWLLDYSPPVGRMGTLPFVAGIPDSSESAGAS